MGGHDLPAGGGGGLHRAGKFRPIAGALHHGDGDGAGGHGVAHGRAGYHAAQGGRDDGDLGRAAGGCAGSGVCQIDEEIGDPGPLQERAEDDKHHDVFGADADGRAHHAGGGEKQIIDHLAEAHIEKSVGQQCAYHAQDRDAHAAAAQLHIGEDGHHGHGHHFGIPGNARGQLDDGMRVQRAVKEGDRPQKHKRHIIPGKGVGAHMFFADGVVQIADDQDETEENIQLFLRHHCAEQRLPDAVYGKSGAEAAHKLPGRALPDADVGFPVVFFHNSFHICGAICFLTGRLPDFRGHDNHLSVLDFLWG